MTGLHHQLLLFINNMPPLFFSEYKIHFFSFTQSFVTIRMEKNGRNSFLNIIHQNYKQILPKAKLRNYTWKNHSWWGWSLLTVYYRPRISVHLRCIKTTCLIDLEINGAVDVVFRCQEKQSVSKSKLEAVAWKVACCKINECDFERARTH